MIAKKTGAILEDGKELVLFNCSYHDPDVSSYQKQVRAGLDKDKYYIIENKRIGCHIKTIIKDLCIKIKELQVKAKRVRRLENREAHLEEAKKHRANARLLIYAYKIGLDKDK